MPRDAIPDASDAEAAADAARRAHDLRDAARAGRPPAGDVDQDETAAGARHVLEAGATAPAVPDPHDRP